MSYRLLPQPNDYVYDYEDIKANSDSGGFTSVAVNSNDNEFNFSREFLPSDRTFRAVNLHPMRNYEFTVAARTALGWGYAARGLVYTTNRREPPQPPSAPRISPSQVRST